MHYSDFIIKPPVIAHRGVSALYPENTLIALKKAKEHGLNWIECDVTLTKDGKVVVIHDDTVDRTTTGHGLVFENNFADLRKLDAGGWFSNAFIGERIPTLKEVLLLLAEFKLSANIEIKALPGREKQLVKRVLIEIEQNPKVPLLITSFSKAILKEVRALSKDIPLGLILSDWQEEDFILCAQLSLTSLGLKETLLTEARVKQLKLLVPMVLTYTVNNPHRAHTLLSYGIDAVFSDCPLEMLKAFTPMA